MRTSISLVLLWALSACVSTSLVDRWKDPAYSAGILHKVLVVGVQKDQGRRRVWEDSMVTALTQRGVQAEASYQVFPDKAPAAQDLTDVATRQGFDGVAATHFVDARHRLYFNSDYPYGPGWRRPWGFWGAPYQDGYIEDQTLADYQTDIFTVDATGGKLIWTGVTRSLNPSSTKNVTDEISRVLVPQLVKDGLLMGKHN